MDISKPNTIELSADQIKQVVISSLRQSLQVALTPLADRSTDDDLVDSIKQVLGLYMTLEEHKELMREAALYELAQAAIQAGETMINPGDK